MKTKSKKPKTGRMERFSSAVVAATGSSAGFVVATLIVICWAICGPIFHYSETWQLVINTGTTIITFLMVFLIQKTQNKESLAIQLKLNELVAAHTFASNRLVNVEGLSEDELETVKKYYLKLSEHESHEGDLQTSHSIDEAKGNLAQKKERGNALKESFNIKNNITGNKSI